MCEGPDQLEELPIRISPKYPQNHVKSLSWGVAGYTANASPYKGQPARSLYIPQKIKSQNTSKIHLGEPSNVHLLFQWNYNKMSHIPVTRKQPWRFFLSLWYVIGINRSKRQKEVNEIVKEEFMVNILDFNTLPELEKLTSEKGYFSLFMRWSLGWKQNIQKHFDQSLQKEDPLIPTDICNSLILQM